MELEWSLDFVRTEESKMFLIDNFVKESELVVIAADAGVGKTTFCLQMLDALTNGKSFFGLGIKNPKLCCWLNNEMNSALFIDRADNLASGCGFYVINHKVKILDEKDLEDLSNTMLQKGIKVLFIDSLAQSTSGIDENDNGVYSIILGNLRKYFSDKGITVFMIHHLAKNSRNNAYGRFDQNRLRGASTIVTNADSIFIIEKFKNNALRIETAKSRYGNQFQLDLHFDENGKLVISDKLPTKSFTPIVFDENVKLDNSLVESVSNEIFSLLKAKGSLKQLEISNSINRSKSTVIDTLNKFEGKLWKKEKISKAFVYTIIEDTL